VAADAQQAPGARAFPSEFDRAHVGQILRGRGDWFSAHVLRLCAKTDRVNLERIRLAFPEHVEAYTAWRDSPLDPDAA
jgi:hypothetical protein